MQLYRVSNIFSNFCTYYGTQAEAHHGAKESASHIVPNVRIHLVEIDTSKKGVLNLLNADEDVEREIKAWRLSPRGALVSCNLED